MGDTRICPGCGAVTAFWACEGCGTGHLIEALDVTMRCAACRAKRGLPPTEDQRRYAPVEVPPAVIAAAERNPDLVRRIEENNERLIAFLRERLPAPPRLPAPDYAAIKKSPDSSGFAYPVAALGELGRKMEAVAAEGAQQPNHTFRAITGKEFTLAIQGRWRVYFNKHGRADLPWCIAPEGGGWELAVPAVLIATKGETTYQPKATPDDEDGRPSAWIAVEGVLTVAGGRASITAIAEPEIQTP